MSQVASSDGKTCHSFFPTYPAGEKRGEDSDSDTFDKTTYQTFSPSVFPGALCSPEGMQLTFTLLYLRTKFVLVLTFRVTFFSCRCRPVNVCVFLLVDYLHFYILDTHGPSSYVQMYTPCFCAVSEKR